MQGRVEPTLSATVLATSGMVCPWPSLRTFEEPHIPVPRPLRSDSGYTPLTNQPRYSKPTSMRATWLTTGPTTGWPAADTSSSGFGPDDPSGGAHDASDLGGLVDHGEGVRSTFEHDLAIVEAPEKALVHDLDDAARATTNDLIRALSHEDATLHTLIGGPKDTATPADSTLEHRYDEEVAKTDALIAKFKYRRVLCWTTPQSQTPSEAPQSSDDSATGAHAAPESGASPTFAPPTTSASDVAPVHGAASDPIAPPSPLEAPVPHPLNADDTPPTSPPDVSAAPSDTSGMTSSDTTGPASASASSNDPPTGTVLLYTTATGTDTVDQAPADTSTGEPGSAYNGSVGAGLRIRTPRAATS